MQIGSKTFGECLNEWFRSLGRNWRSLLVVSLVAHIPLGLAVVAVYWLTGANDSFALYFDPDTAASMTSDELLETLGPVLWAVGIWSLLQLAAAVFVYIAGARIVAGDVAGVDFSWRDVNRFAAAKMVVGVGSALLAFIGGGLVMGAVGALGWALITSAGANFLTVFITTTVVLTAFVLLAWIGVSFSLGSQVIALEDAGPVGALGRSFRLVQGRWWTTFGFFAVAGIIASAVSQVLSIVLVPLFLAAAVFPQALAIGFGASIVIQGPLLAAVGAAYALWYIDLRARRETLVAEQLV